MSCAFVGPPVAGRDAGGAARGRREEQHLVEPQQTAFHDARWGSMSRSLLSYTRAYARIHAQLTMLRSRTRALSSQAS
jgi:hypothetical protein